MTAAPPNARACARLDPLMNEEGGLEDMLAQWWVRWRSLSVSSSIDCECHVSDVVQFSGRPGEARRTEVIDDAMLDEVQDKVWRCSSFRTPSCPPSPRLTISILPVSRGQNTGSGMSVFVKFEPQASITKPRFYHGNMTSVRPFPTRRLPTNYRTLGELLCICCGLAQ